MVAKSGKTGREFYTGNRQAGGVVSIGRQPRIMEWVLKKPWKLGRNDWAI
jgi:hypothetical protein